MYISSELFITELKCLAFINYHDTFPFLNCIEMSYQVDLHRILQLYHDSLDNKIDILSNFVRKMHGISVTEITSELAQNNKQNVFFRY